MASVCESCKDAAWTFGEIAPEHLARLAHVSVVTARRWIRRRTLPETARLLVELLLRGDLGTIDAAFAGVQLRRGALHLDSGMIVERGELESIPYRRQQVRALEVRVQSLTVPRGTSPLTAATPLAPEQTATCRARRAR
jgi:hypothetical protein